MNVMDGLPPKLGCKNIVLIIVWHTTTFKIYLDIPCGWTLKLSQNFHNVTKSIILKINLCVHLWSFSWSRFLEMQSLDQREKNVFWCLHI